MKRARKVIRRAASESAAAVARLWRRRVAATAFVGVTGTSGKTTTKELAAAVLATRLRGTHSRGTRNSLEGVVKQVLRVRRGDDFCVQELGAAGPGSLDRAIAVLQPRVAVVTNVGLEHYKKFRSREAVAAEKGKLVAALRPDGVAILNADDPLVLGMAARCRGRVLTFGTTDGAQVRGLDVAASWPDRLSLTVVCGDRRVAVETRLCGAHWAPAVLAALAVGLALEVPLEEGAGALAGKEPWPGRMSPAQRSDGVTFIRDDWKAPVGSIPPALEFLRTARAARKILVLGTLSDYAGSNEKRYAAVAREALRVVDHALFVGRWSKGALRARTHETAERLHVAASLEEARKILARVLQPGDLVLLKGSRTVDGLHRLVEAPADPRSSVEQP